MRLTGEDGVKFTVLPIEPLAERLVCDTCRLGGVVASWLTMMEISETEQQVVIEPERGDPLLLALIVTKTV